MSDERMAAIEDAADAYGLASYSHGFEQARDINSQAYRDACESVERTWTALLALLAEPEPPAISEAGVEAAAAALAGAPSVLAFKNSWRDDEIARHRKVARKALDAARRAREGATE